MFGALGTIIAVHKTTSDRAAFALSCDIVFDKPHPSCGTLSGRAPEARGLSLPNTSLLNLSQPPRHPQQQQHQQHHHHHHHHREVKQHTHKRQQQDPQSQGSAENIDCFVDGPQPAKELKSLGISTSLMDGLEERKSFPTWPQEEKLLRCMIPAIATQKDVVVTTTTDVKIQVQGKKKMKEVVSRDAELTAAAVSALHGVDSSIAQIQVLVVVGKRTIAAAARERVVKLKEEGVNVVSVFGGGGKGDIKRQIAEIANNDTQIVVGTPGIIKNLQRKKAINGQTIKAVYLVNADSLLSNHGLRDSTLEILERLPKTIQLVVLCGAKVPRELIELLGRFARKAIRVHCDT
uniref:5'-3' exoribonuclease 1 SH3-like domain-containing protein n=2 Tax=Lotharella globosa TaxID=91324 RepID=A0A7S4DUF8_9EUKA|mmetsp:Transcript_8169/g.15401  ORF Transcript_8169/g.15401 Transcript_8169/m.15401 type:complete len:348 (-) Transcript_8169:107-1150(-)